MVNWSVRSSHVSGNPAADARAVIIALFSLFFRSFNISAKPAKITSNRYVRYVPIQAETHDLFSLCSAFNLFSVWRQASLWSRGYIKLPQLDLSHLFRFRLTIQLFCVGRQLKLYGYPLGQLRINNYELRI